MTYVPNSLAVVKTALTADVANNGTVTVGYPTGFVQNSFLHGSAGPDSYVVVSHNNKYTAAAAKCSFSFGASLITITNLSGETWLNGSPFYVNLDQVDGTNASVLNIPITMAQIATGDFITVYPGVDGTLEDLEFLVTTPVTTGSKAATLSAKIDGVAVTGGAVALTSANTTPLGAVVSATAITAANRVNKGSAVVINAASVTTFIEGAGVLSIRLRPTTL